MRSGRRRRGGAQRKQSFSDINMTPFIDVMLVLLVIFMVALPQPWAVEIFGAGSVVPPPPTTEKAEPKTLVTVTGTSSTEVKKGDVKIVATSLGQLPDAFKGIGMPKDDVVYLKGDDCVPYDLVFKTLAELRSMGLKPVFVTKPGITKEEISGSRPSCPDASSR
jgi:biopolymer transport protein TolR